MDRVGLAPQKARISRPAQFLDRDVPPLPRLTRNSGNQFHPDALEGPHCLIRIEPDTRWKQRRDILAEASCELLQHSLLGHGPGDGCTFERQIVIEAGDHLVGVQFKLVEAVMQIEQVAILAPLQERAELGPKQFFGLEGRDFDSAAPSGTNRNTRCIECSARSVRHFPSHDKAARIASTVPPMGSAWICTRSMSSE